MDESGDEDGVEAGFFSRLDPQREDWVLQMLRSAHVRKSARRVDWKTSARTAKAMLDGRVLETIPIMGYVWEQTNRVLAREELLQGPE